MDFRAEGATACVVIIVLIIGGATVYQFGVVPLTGLPGFDDMLGLTAIPVDPDWEQPDYVPEDSHRVTVELEGLTQDTLSATAGSMYLWYDADGDGTVDVGEGGIGSEGSEVEAIAITSSAGTSKRTYWTGATIGIQTHITDCYSNYVERIVPDMGEFDTSVPLDTVYVVDVYTSATAIAADQNSVALTTSADYNYTTDGATLTMTVTLSITAGGEGFGTPGYTDWDTGDSYVGPFMSIKLDDADDGAFEVNGWDITDDRGGYIYYIWYLTPFFNDADVTADGRISFTVVIDDIIADSDFDLAFYDTVEADNFNARRFGIVDAEVSDIDFVSAA